jgi:HD superfamily phosphohydrolase
MFLMVYFHYRAVCLEQMIYKYFQECPDEYQIPSDINLYKEHDDHHLLKILRNSNNQWAQRIIQNKIPKKIFEVFGKNTPQLNVLEQLTSFLKDENIDYICCESTGRLSKYYNEKTYIKQNFPLKVLCQYPKNKSNPRLININQATSLYQKYSESHAVTRIHVDFDSLNHGQKNTIENIINT